MHFIATAARGTEDALVAELRECGASDVRRAEGGVAFRGGRLDGWNQCLYSRIASTIIVRLAEGDTPSPDVLYALVRTIDWSQYLTPAMTLAVHAECRNSRIRHSGFVALRTKDAIVDQIRDAVGARPSVQRDDPDARVQVRLVRDRAFIGLDLAGAPLHRRGYRGAAGPAPLRETLAAAILRLAQWDRCAPLLDPMCGSGTFAIEAALWAMNRAPGILRDRFGFERWADYDASARERMAALRAAARAAETELKVDVVAGDIDPRVLEHARSGAGRAGVKLRFYRGAAERDMPRFSVPALVVANPPYGVRMGNVRELYAGFARALRGRDGDSAALLSGNPEMERALQRRPAAKHELRNGDLPCRLLLYRL